MKTFPSVMPASGCNNKKPGQLADSNPSTVEVSGPMQDLFSGKVQGERQARG